MLQVSDVHGTIAILRSGIMSLQVGQNDQKLGSLKHFQLVRDLLYENCRYFIIFVLISLSYNRLLSSAHVIKHSQSTGILPLLRIRVVLPSNLGPETGYPDSEC